MGENLAMVVKDSACIPNGSRKQVLRTSRGGARNRRGKTRLQKRNVMVVGDGTNSGC